MLLFDIIRDWFVQYIWGGVTSQGAYFSCSLGTFADTDNFNPDYAYTDSLYLSIGKAINGSNDTFVNSITIGDWLSTTSTIIVMILLCVVFGLMVRWLFRLTAGLLRGN